MTDVVRRDLRSQSGRRRGGVPLSGRRNLRRKVAAVLAGGLVLGVGTATTLAAWTDQEQAQATFTAGIFKLESRIDSGVFADHTTTVAQLPFSATGMSPGSIHYAFLDVKTTSDSTSAGTSKFMPGTVSADSAGMAGFLKLRVAVIGSSTDCNVAAVGSAPQVVIDAVPGSLTDKPLSVKGGNTQRYCLEVSMAANAPSTLQGKAATVTWTVAGTSNS